MKTRLDKLNGRIEVLIAKKEKLEAQQREKLAELFLQLVNKGIDAKALAGLMLNSPDLLKSENKEVWQIAGQKFLSSSSSRKAILSSPTAYSNTEPETTSSQKKETACGL